MSSRSDSRAGARPPPPGAAIPPALRAPPQRELEPALQLLSIAPVRAPRRAVRALIAARLRRGGAHELETASARLVAPSLRRMFLTWYLTVPSRTTSTSAISRVRVAPGEQPQDLELARRQRLLRVCRPRLGGGAGRTASASAAGAGARSSTGPPTAARAVQRERLAQHRALEHARQPLGELPATSASISSTLGRWPRHRRAAARSSRPGRPAGRRRRSQAEHLGKPGAARAPHRAHDDDLDPPRGGRPRPRSAGRRAGSGVPAKRAARRRSPLVDAVQSAAAPVGRPRPR